MLKAKAREAKKSPQAFIVAYIKGKIADAMSKKGGSWGVEGRIPHLSGEPKRHTACRTNVKSVYWFCNAAVLPKKQNRVLGYNDF